MISCPPPALAGSTSVFRPPAPNQPWPIYQCAGVLLFLFSCFCCLSFCFIRRPAERQPPANRWLQASAVSVAVGWSKRPRAPSIELVDHNPVRVRINIYARLHVRLLIGLILGSVASVDLVVSRIGISVEGLSIVLHQRDLSCGQRLHMLLLLGGGYSVGFETRLLEHDFFFRRAGSGGCRGAGASRDKGHGRDRTENTC